MVRGMGGGGEGKGWLVVEGGAKPQIINNQIIFILYFINIHSKAWVSNT